MTQRARVNQVCGFDLNMFFAKNFFFCFIDGGRNIINGTFSNTYNISRYPRRFARLTIRVT